MDTPQVGDWVRTKDGHEGRVLLVSRLTAFLDYGNESKGGPAGCLLSDLIKIEAPSPSSDNSPSAR
jgi:hypothetical protein